MPTVQFIAEAIADYIRHHQSGADTLEGVMQWWLSDDSNIGPPQGSTPSTPQHSQAFIHRTDVEEAIELLLHQKILDCRELTDGSTVYFAGVNVQQPFKFQ